MKATKKKDTKRAASSLDAQRRFKDRRASIDQELDDAVASIDWKRRRRAEKSISAWVETYCVGLLLDDTPPAKGVVVLEQMASALTSHRNYMICMPRGAGKSSYVECTSLYALALGI